MSEYDKLDDPLTPTPNISKPLTVLTTVTLTQLDILRTEAVKVVYT